MTNQFRPGSPPLPSRLLGMPIDERGYLVPYFVAVVNGQPDHRVVEPNALRRCIHEHRCWVCGRRLDRTRVSVIGPMCGINRISAEPPMHEDCARYAVQACPFLTKPHAHRRDAGMPSDAVAPAGTMLAHNPGVILLWWSQRGAPVRVPGGEGINEGVLFYIGDPLKVEWWTTGRLATRVEAEAAIAAGLPKLRELCQTPDDFLRLNEHREALRALLPEVSQ